MRAAFVMCALALASCKREEDAPQQSTTATSARPAETTNAPTQLVALAQPSDSAPEPTPTLTPTQTPTQTATATPTSTPTQAPTRTSSVVMGAVSANGLPAETVQRVVRQNLGRFRQCYDAGLRGNPALKGRVTTRITIDASGSIMSAEDAGSDLPDQTVAMCVIGAYGNLSFPQPEAGSAVATVPIVFSPPP